MINVHCLCNWAASMSYEQLPPRIRKNTIVRLNTIRNHKTYNNSSVLWSSSHLGGQFDGALDTYAKTAKYKRISSKRWVLATAVASEVSSRIGTGLLLSSSQRRQTFSILSFNLIFEGILMRKDEIQLANAMSQLFQLAPVVTFRNNANDWHIHQLLIAWSNHCIENPPQQCKSTDIPFLQSAVTSLGSVWLSNTVSIAQVPGPLSWHPMLLSTIEILNRHIKAADKRLRIDQISAIEFHIPHFCIPQTDVLQKLISTYILKHEWNPILFDEKWRFENQENIYKITNKIKYIPSYEKTTEYWNELLNRLTCLFSGVSPEEILTVAGLSGLGKWKLNRQLRENLGRLKYQKNTLELSVVEQFQHCIPTETFVFTTRGGKWPDRKSAPSPNGHLGSQLNFNYLENQEIVVKGKAIDTFQF
jgi:hypothetical protein